MKTFLAAATAAALSLGALTTAHAGDKQADTQETIVFMQDAELNKVEGAFIRDQIKKAKAAHEKRVAAAIKLFLTASKG